MNKEYEKLCLKDRCEIDYIIHSFRRGDIEFDKRTKLEQKNEQLKENNQAMQEEMARTWEKHDKLQNNWNELKEWLEELIKESGLEGIIQASIFNHVLEKMQEIESRKQ